MTRNLTKPEIIRLATAGVNNLRWFAEAGKAATCARIDWGTPNNDADVATFYDGKLSQGLTWKGLEMAVRMGWCAEDKRACPETFAATWLDAHGLPCDPWDAETLEIYCTPKEK